MSAQRSYLRERVRVGWCDMVRRPTLIRPCGPPSPNGRRASYFYGATFSQWEKGIVFLRQRRANRRQAFLGL